MVSGRSRVVQVIRVTEVDMRLTHCGKEHGSRENEYDLINQMETT